MIDHLQYPVRMTVTRYLFAFGGVSLSSFIVYGSDDTLIVVCVKLYDLYSYVAACSCRNLVVDFV